MWSRSVDVKSLIVHVAWEESCSSCSAAKVKPVWYSNITNHYCCAPFDWTGTSDRSLACWDHLGSISSVHASMNRLSCCSTHVKSACYGGVEYALLNSRNITNIDKKLLLESYSYSHITADYFAEHKDNSRGVRPYKESFCDAILTGCRVVWAKYRITVGFAKERRKVCKNMCITIINPYDTTRDVSRWWSR